MLTRLKINGFKNLVDVDVRFGPFTCIAGANGVGKSNLFDAIRFLSALADRPLIEAATVVRDEGGRTSDVQSLFHRVADHYDREMSFEAEMIVPQKGVDDLGQEATATITFLRYSLSLVYRREARGTPGSLEITKEELVHIILGDASRHLLFPHSVAWRQSVLRGSRRAPYFISTEGAGPNRVIKRHQDGGSTGRPLSLSAANLPRTVLSAANAAESPTALLARREMQSWSILQLEPSSLRKPDDFNVPTSIGMDGSHLAATLYHLAHHTSNIPGQSKEEAAAQIYAQVANRLSELIDDVYEVGVDRDERRELLTLQVTGHNHTPHSARALSDGTLRFLALTVLELDPETQGLLCLEEPENGIHPARIPAMLELLQDIATDLTQPIGSDNPLRQVIINTHSPAVVEQVPDGSLLVAELKETVQGGQLFKRGSFGCLQGDWRQRGESANVVPRGKLLNYLNPVALSENEADSNGQDKHPASSKRAPKGRRIVDRPDLQIMLPFPTETPVW